MRIRVLFLLATSVLLISYANVTPTYTIFNAPKTEAEKALDGILKRATVDANFFEFVLKRPWFDPAKGNDYSTMLTQTLLDTLAAREAKYVKEDCGGKYLDGEICGLDYDPITCGQDPPLAYRFRTRMQKEGVAVISTVNALSSNDFANYRLIADEYPPTYRMLKVNGQWQLDGIDCGDANSNDDYASRFNMKKTRYFP